MKEMTKLNKNLRNLNAYQQRVAPGQRCRYSVLVMGWLVRAGLQYR